MRGKEMLLQRRQMVSKQKIFKIKALFNNGEVIIIEIAIVIKTDLSQNEVDSSQIGPVGKRLSNKIDNDIAVAWSV